MKYIFETYGHFLLEGMLIVLVFGILFSVRDAEGNIGVLKILGGGWNQGYSDISPDVGFAAYEVEAAKTFPSLEYAYDGKIYANEELRITSFLKMQGYGAQQLRMQILHITDAAGQDKRECYDAGTGKICFPKEGIYELKISVKDASYKKYTCAINVPVNKRG